MFDGYIKVTVVTDKRERSIAGTVFCDGKPRFIQIKGINIDAEMGAHMLYTTNEDVPGIIGVLGQTHGRKRREHRELYAGPGRSRRRGHCVAVCRRLRYQHLSSNSWKRRVCSLSQTIGV